MTIHTMAGIEDAQLKLSEVATVLRLPRLVRLKALRIPTGLSAFGTGLRLALARPGFVASRGITRIIEATK